MTSIAPEPGRGYHPAMPTFVRLTPAEGNAPVLVNMDRVNWIRPLRHGGMRLHFDQGVTDNQLDVLETLEQIEQAVGVVHA